MRTLTTDQLDDLYRSFKREVPLGGSRHTMTITEYYRDVWSKRGSQVNNQEDAADTAAPAGLTVTSYEGRLSTAPTTSRTKRATGVATKPP